MRKLTLLLAVVGGLLSACQSKTKQTEATTQPIDTTAQTSMADSTAAQCYAYYSAQDTIRLTMTRTGETVTGNLQYQLSGKDRNTGTIAGQMRGDTLLADYTFQSEGRESVREVAFLVQNERMVEGFGPIAEQGGKMAFSDRKALKFTSAMALNKTACP